MHIVRTIIWVLIFAAILLISYFNWRPVEVTIWENIVWDTKLPAVMIVSFLLGFLPMWLFNRGQKWRYGRRIKTLESATAARPVMPTQPAPPPTPAPTPAPAPAATTTSESDDGGLKPAD